MDYRCSQDPPVSSPPYGCTAQQYRITVHFPECWNPSYDEPDYKDPTPEDPNNHDSDKFRPGSLVDMSGGECPSSHPYQILTIRMAVHYDNVGGILEGPLMVSAGDGTFLVADFFHADVFDAPPQPGFNDTITKCVNNVADGATPPAVCRPSLRPETTLASSGPSGTVASNSATFAFSSPNEPDATFQCQVYQAGTTPGTFGACSGNGTHSVRGLRAGTYTFEVRAVEPHSGQTGAPASRTWTVDHAATTVIAAPSNLTATLGGTTRKPQISLKWTDNSNNEYNFVVERRVNNDTNWAPITPLPGLAANTTSYTDNTVQRRTTYTYRVKATKGAKSSAYSNEDSVRTN